MHFRRRVQADASEERLEGLIRERLKPGSDKAAIDERIWELKTGVFHRPLRLLAAGHGRSSTSCRPSTSPGGFFTHN